MEEKKESEKHEHHEHNVEHHKKKSDWKILSGILAVVVIVLLIVLFYPKLSGASLSANAAGSKLVDYLNTKTGGGVSFVSAESMGSNIYNVIVSYQGQQIPVFVSKDGKYFIQGAVPIEENTTTPNPNNQNTQPANVPKSDKPKVELFVMTHCPYGTQAEKGLIPTLKALGNTIDGKIRFVHYFMHGDKEEKETYNQVCIRDEQNAKYFTYLECFLASTGSEADAKKCLTIAAIDTTKLNACLANNYTIAKKYYAVDQGLSNQYGVQGSPTLVINGAEANSGRDSASYLKTICSAFNTPGTACSQQLSSTSPGAGFGTTAAASGASTDAQC